MLLTNYVCQRVKLAYLRMNSPFSLMLQSRSPVLVPPRYCLRNFFDILHSSLAGAFFSFVHVPASSDIEFEPLQVRASILGSYPDVETAFQSVDDVTDDGFCILSSDCCGFWVYHWKPVFRRVGRWRKNSIDSVQSETHMSPEGLRLDFVSTDRRNS